MYVKISMIMKRNLAHSVAHNTVDASRRFDSRVAESVPRNHDWKYAIPSVTVYNENYFK